MWYLYIVKIPDGKLYTGITTDIARRMKQHDTGKGAKSLRGRGPVVLQYTESFQTRSDALKREAEIHGWSHREKVELIRTFGLHPSR